MNMATFDALYNSFATENIIKYLLQAVLTSCIKLEGNINLDIKYYPLLGPLLKIMDANIDIHLVIFQKEASAMNQAWMRE